MVIYNCIRNKEEKNYEEQSLSNYMDKTEGEIYILIYESLFIFFSYIS